MKIPKHILLDYSTQPNQMVCDICKQRRNLHLPGSISDISKQFEAFSESHKHCKANHESIETQNFASL